MARKKGRAAKEMLHTSHGRILCGDSLQIMADQIDDKSIDLIVTSPPFGLVRKNDYGNVDAEKYVPWFTAFGRQLRRIQRPTGRARRSANGWPATSRNAWGGLQSSRPEPRR